MNMRTPAGVPQCASLIDGERLTAGDIVERRNPSDTSEIVSVSHQATPADALQAVAAARKAFPAWARMVPQARADLLDKIATLVQARREDLAVLLSREEGKTLPESRAEVTKTAQLFKFFAGEAVRIGGLHGRSVRDGIDVDVVREPAGIAVLITPWNFPISIPAWKLAPALAYGNCAILKPSELTPGCAQALADILTEAGVPRGVFQMVLGGGDVGAALVSHADVDLVSFTGSTATGKRIADSMRGGRAQLQLELGGKNPLIVMADANIDAAVDAAVKGAFYSSGQRCTASSRLIVEDAAHDRFVEQVAARMRKLHVGHALEATSDIGPLVSAMQLRGVQESVACAKAGGSNLLLGGEALERPTEGHFMAPALFIDTRPADMVNREEVFGPVASVLRARSLDEAITIANDTPYGLTAGIYTNSHAAAREFRQRTTAGMAMVNLQTVGTDYHVPFGGNGDSGFGVREMGQDVRSFFTRSRTIYTA